MTLQELTGQESGIVIYPGGETIICNWATTCPNDNQLPLLFAGAMLIAWEGEEIKEAGPSEEIENWRDCVNKFCVIYDENQDVDFAPCCKAIVYHLEDGTSIVAPREWN